MSVSSKYTCSGLFLEEALEKLQFSRKLRPPPHLVIPAQEENNLLQTFGPGRVLKERF